MSIPHKQKWELFREFASNSITSEDDGNMGTPFSSVPASHHFYVKSVRECFEAIKPALHARMSLPWKPAPH